VTQQFSLWLTHGLRLLCAAACLWGAWWSWNLGRADFLFREDTPESVRAAIRLVPDQPQYYMRLAQLDGGRATEYLETALSLNRYNAQASIELALQREADGNYASAEKLLLDAFAVDRTYISRWTLANFYFRRDDMPAFWKWARRAAEMPANDIGALFQLCWRAAPDPELIADRVLTDQPDTIRQYLAFLMNHGDIRAAATAPSIRAIPRRQSRFGACSPTAAGWWPTRRSPTMPSSRASLCRWLSTGACLPMRVCTRGRGPRVWRWS